MNDSYTICAICHKPIRYGEQAGFIPLSDEFVYSCEKCMDKYDNMEWY